MVGTITSYVQGQWIAGKGQMVPLLSAYDGTTVGETSSAEFDFKGILEYGRRVSSTKLRQLTFHQRALMLKELAKFLMDRKEEFYKLSPFTGATKMDSWIDIEGGISTLFVFSSKGRRELPNQSFYVEGKMEAISKNGTFVGQHICVPLEGVAVHINAFNFPCWAMLEKFAPTFLAGMATVVKPATATCYLAQRMVQEIVSSKIIPEGALQLICGGVGDLFNYLTCQDVVTFTGSAETGKKLKQHPVILNHAVRFNMEADSLNCSILGPDVAVGGEEFDLYIKEVARELTVKAGQKCTAIRRTLVPAGREEAVIKALRERLAKTTLGDPNREDVRMGPLVGRSQLEEVRANFEKLKAESELVIGQPDEFELLGGDKKNGAFLPPLALYCKDPLRFRSAHEIEAFGPITTIMPYQDIDQAVALAALGKGSLVASLCTADNNIARKVVLGIAAYHGRLMILNKDCAKESTGHGSPLPHLIHGGPGRAGGGEEMGGIRAVLHYMQRTALQGSPTTLSTICKVWLSGAEEKKDPIHPFRKYFDELQIGETLLTHRRTITEADVVNFACLSGDHFYAHMDDIAAKESLFGKRVAHGYFILAAAAGLFVDPAPGPVLANYGLENLRFIKPVYPGDTIRVKLTVQEKTPKEDKPEGVVAWAVQVMNQNEELVASYSILTLVQRKS